MGAEIVCEKHAAVATSFQALRNDGVGAVVFKPLGFLDGGGGGPNLNAPSFELLHPLGLWQTKVEADHRRFELAHECEAFFAERRAAWPRAHRRWVNAV